MWIFLLGMLVGGGLVFGVGGANYMLLRKAYLSTKKKLEDAELYIKSKSGGDRKR